MTPLDYATTSCVRPSDRKVYERGPGCYFSGTSLQGGIHPQFNALQVESIT